jgi:hypothetical protein
MFLSLKNNTQRKIGIKYYQKLLDNTEQEIKKFESKLISCEVNIRKLRERQIDLIEKMCKVECELNEGE